MKILVINAGSSSLKYQLIDTENNKMLAKGLCERVGSKDSYIKHGADKDERIFAQYMADHEEALAVVSVARYSDATFHARRICESDASRTVRMAADTCTPKAGATGRTTCRKRPPAACREPFSRIR